MAGRFARLLQSLGVEGVVFVSGGLAADDGLAAALEASLRQGAARGAKPLEIARHPLSAYAGAIGAAIWGAFRRQRVGMEGAAWTANSDRAPDCPDAGARGRPAAGPHGPAITGRNRSAWYEGKLKRALAESDVKISLGAELDGFLVGAVLGSLHYGEFGQPEPIASSTRSWSTRTAPRRGVGRALLESLTRNLRALGIERLRTEVAWDEHELSRFLGRAGFAPAPRLVLELRLEGEASGRPSASPDPGHIAAPTSA